MRTSRLRPRSLAASTSLALAPVLALVMAACSGDGAIVVLDLRTDIVPNVEFAAVETILTEPRDVQQVAALVGQDFVRGERIAELRNVPLGERVIDVSLLARDGSVVAERQVRIDVEGDLGLTVLITRDCVGMTCGGGNACVAGTCAPDTCVETGSACPAAECTSASDCPAPAASCAEARCVGGACLYATVSGACPDAEACVPDEGCTGIVLADAGVDSGVMVDAGSDGGLVDGGHDGGTVDGGDEGYNVVFVTSIATAPGTFGGLAGASTLCQALAMSAGLPRPSSYRAFLPTIATDARAQITGSRGWVRVDGLPFVDTDTDLAAGRIYYPIALDEAGDPAPVTSVATSTNADSTRGGETCGDWDDTAARVGRIGDPRDTTVRWTDSAGSTDCSTPLAIYCFGTGLSRPLPPPVAPPGAARAFQSQSTVNAQMGLGALDALCEADAAEAGYTGTFRALVAPSDTESALSASRFSMTSGPWYRPDGAKVGDTLLDLAASQLLAPPNVTVGMSYESHRVWAGADTPGVAGTQTCGSWTMSGSGSTGFSSSTTAFFHAGGATLCSVGQRVLCFQD